MLGVTVDDIFKSLISVEKYHNKLQFWSAWEIYFLSIQERIFTCHLLYHISIIVHKPGISTAIIFLRWPIGTKQNHKTQNRIAKFKTELQKSKQNHETLKQNRKTQNKIKKPKTESQTSKQNHKTLKQNRKTQNKGFVILFWVLWFCLVPIGHRRFRL